MIHGRENEREQEMRRSFAFTFGFEVSGYLKRHAAKGNSKRAASDCPVKILTKMFAH
jgi:hypothetical protein